MNKRTLNLETYIPALLTFVSSKLSTRAGEIYRRRFGVGITEWRILATVAVEPDVPASRICQLIGIDKALASRVVQSLKSRGFVMVRRDARNGSRYFIRLTAAGERIHDQILTVVKEREKILHSGFSADEISTIVDLLHRLHKQADVVNAYEPFEKEADNGRGRPQHPKRRGSGRRKRRTPQA
jgi:DNA-binding MarR family transcriptional regulator